MRAGLIPRFSISDLFTLTVLTACTTVFIIRAFRFNFSADVLAHSIPQETVGVVTRLATVGLVAFPVIFLALSLIILKIDSLRLRNYFAVYFLALAILSVPFSYTVAVSCARAMAN